MKKIILTSGVLAVAGLVSLPITMISQPVLAQAPGGEAPAMPVSVISVEKTNINITRSLPGRVSAFKQSQVRPQVDGIVTERLFEEGATVEKVSSFIKLMMRAIEQR